MWKKTEAKKFFQGILGVGSWRAFWGLGLPGDLDLKPAGGRPTLPSRLKNLCSGPSGLGDAILSSCAGSGVRGKSDPLKMPLRGRCLLQGNGGAREGSTQVPFTYKTCHCEFEPYTLLGPRFLHISFNRGSLRNGTVVAFVCAVTAGDPKLRERGLKKKCHSPENFHSAFA